MQRERSDVLIIGGGIAGFATALDLLDGGKSVLLVDRDRESAFGGLARESFGGMFFVDFTGAAPARHSRFRSAGAARLVQLCRIRRGRSLAQSLGRGLCAALHGRRLSLGARLWGALPARGQLGRAWRIPPWQFGASLPRRLGYGQGVAEALIAALRGHRNAGRLPCDSIAASKGF